MTDLLVRLWLQCTQVLVRELDLLLAVVNKILVKIHLGMAIYCCHSFVITSQTTVLKRIR